MSNMTNLHKCLLRIPLSQSITITVFLHWFKPMAFRIFLFAVSKMALLMLPNSFLAGFTSLTVGLLLKFSLWSFRVIKVFCTNRFSTSLFFKICFPSIRSVFLCFCWLSCISWLWCCLSYDCVPLLLIGKGLFFLSAKVTVLWDDLINWMSFFTFFWKWFLVFLNLMFCTNAVR